MEWESHTPPEEHFNINFEAALRCLQDAAPTVMFYSQDHWGYAHYLSDVAVRHPHLKVDNLGSRRWPLPKSWGMCQAATYYSLQFDDQMR